MMSANLKLALLSLDSYNRGYGQVVKFNPTDSELNENERGKRLGAATILSDANDLGGISRTAGFYGIAYDVSGAGIDGLSGTVVSYRGTNANWSSENLAEFLATPGVRDAVNGWIVGAGVPGGQANLALDFYNAVAGVDPFSANVTLTGHSLGAGLAGYVGSLYGRSGTLFDHMPFARSTSLAYLASVQAIPFDLRQRIYGTGPVMLPNSGGLTALATTGEALTGVRAAAAAVFTADEAFLSPLVQNVDSNGGARGVVDLHSMPLLVNLLWASDNVSDQWESAGTQLWDAFFNESVAESLVDIEDSRGPLGTNLAVLQSAIAYSALDPRDAPEPADPNDPPPPFEMPFGNVGIRAMFDDAGDLGAIVANSQIGLSWENMPDDFHDRLAQYLVKFAGSAALGDAEENLDAPGEGSRLTGVLSQEVLQGAFSIITGTDYLSPGNYEDDHDRSIILPIVEDALVQIGYNRPTMQTEDLRNWDINFGSNPQTPGLDDLLISVAPHAAWISAFTFVENVGSTPYIAEKLPIGNGLEFIPGGTLLRPDGGIRLITGSSEGNTIYGSANDEIIQGGSGSDNLAGGVGFNILVGGSGVDRLDYGDEQYFAGGTVQINIGTVVDDGNGGQVTVDSVRSSSNRGSGTDEVFQFERIVTGEGNDKLLIESLGVSSNLWERIDLGAAGVFNTQDNDIINARSLDERVLIDLRQTLSQSFSAPTTGRSFELANVESAVGTKFNDVIHAVDRGFNTAGSNIITMDGADQLFGGSGSDFLAAGDGDDIIHAGRGDIVMGGGDADQFFLTSTVPQEYLWTNNVFLLDYNVSADQIFIDNILFSGVTKTANPVDRHVQQPGNPNNIVTYVDTDLQSAFGLVPLVPTQSSWVEIRDKDLDVPIKPYLDGKYRDIIVSTVNGETGQGRITLIDADISWLESFQPWQIAGVALTQEDDGQIVGRDSEGNIVTASVQLNQLLNIYVGGTEQDYSSLATRIYNDAPADFAGLLRSTGGNPIIIGPPSVAVGSEPRQQVTLSGLTADGNRFDDYSDFVNTALQGLSINGISNIPDIPLPFMAAAAALPGDEPGDGPGDGLGDGPGDDPGLPPVPGDSRVSFRTETGLDVILPVLASDYQFFAFEDLLTSTDLSDIDAVRIGTGLSLDLLGIIPAGAEMPAENPFSGFTKFGSAQDEQIQGTGNSDVLIGNSGDDVFTLTATGGGDVDLVSGGAGDDIYTLDGTTGGFDKIIIAERLDQGDAAGGFDVLNINAASTEVTVVDGNSPSDLRILVPGGGADGIINLVNQLGPDPDDWIEEIRFTDGVTWTRSELIAEAVAAEGPAAAALADVTLPEDAAVDIDVGSAFSDPYRRDIILSATLANGDPLPDSLLFANGRLTGTLPADFNGQLDIVVSGTVGTETVSSNLALIVTPENDAPEVINPLDSVVLDEGVAVDIAVPVDTFADVDGDSLTLTALQSDGSPLPAWLSFDGSRFTGTPPQDFVGFIDLSVTASDGLLDVTDTFTLSVEQFVNSAPVVALALVDQASPEDTFVDIAIPAGSFTDIDGDTLTLTATLLDGSSLPAWLVFDGERITGQPPQDFSGTLELTVTASDGLLEASDNFTLAIDPVNDAPTLSMMVSDQTSLEDEAIDFAIPADTFADVDGNTLTISATQADGSDLPAWLSFDGERFTGQPPQDFNGLIEIALTASDGEFQASDLFALSIVPVNDSPVVLTPLVDISSSEDSLVDVTIPSDTFVDVDGDPLTLTATLSDGSDLPAWLSFDGARISGTPPQDFNGNIEIAVTASDGELDIIDHFVLTIDPVNDAPVVLNPIADINSAEDTVVNVALPGNVFADVDGDLLALTATLLDGSDLPVWLNFDGARFTGMPPADFNGVLDIRVTADDGALQTTSDFALTIDPVNDAPVLAVIPADVASDEDTAFDIALPPETFTDVEGDALTLTAALVGGEVLPDWISFDGERFTGTPPQDFNGVLDVEVTANDGELGTATSFLFTINPVNDAPVAVDDDIFLSEGSDELTILQSSLLDNDSDVDGDTLTVTSVSDGANGTVDFDVDGNVVYTPNAGFEGEDSFTYTVSDGELTSTASARLRIDDPFSGWRQGTEGNDFLFGNFFQSNEIFARGGNDYVFGGFREDYLAGGDGDDRIFGLFSDDHLWGNAGDDKLFGGFGTDTAYFSGTSSEYELQTEYGGFFVRTRDEDPNVNGDDGRDQLYSIERLSFIDGETISVSSPIILDLDGDGSEFVSASESNALFDLDNDGVRDDTSWIGSGDAFLFLDRNGDGFVSGVGEISFVDDVEDAKSDLDGLRAFDTNGDNILSSQDDRFSEFGVWQDLDTDGEVDAGETFTLSQAGVVSIDLNAQATAEGFKLGDVAVINQGRFLRSDGTTGGYADTAITFFQKGVAALPEISFANESFARKSNKYRLHAENGELKIGTKKAATQSLTGASTLQFKNKSIGLLTPIILDLDGDGVEMVKNKKTKVSFDIDGNGTGDPTGWIGRDDGFLVVDRNYNGTIDDGSELSFLVDSPNAKSDLQALTAFDSNADGIVSSLDFRFGELKIWVDGNGNGVTDQGELRTLADHGIVSLSLDGQATSARVKVGNNILLATSTFTRTDGSQGAVGDAVLSFTPSASPAATPNTWFGGDGIDSFLSLSGNDGLEALAEGRFEEQKIPELVALRAGLSIESAPNGANLFDYYERPNAAPVAPAGVATTDVVSKESVPAGVIEPDVAVVDQDALRVALMTQEMSVFGASNAATLEKMRDRTVAPMEYFAA